MGKDAAHFTTPRKVRIVIVGAGMAGLSAAFHLQRSLSATPSQFELTVLEASERIGGRICTSHFGGDQVELGATWIHGIEGSPLYEIAERIGALNKGDAPWERQDGFPGNPIMRAEGGLIVDPAIIESVVDAYKKAMLEVRDRGELETSGKKKFMNGSVGDFLRQGLNSFLSQQQVTVSEIEKLILSSMRKDFFPSQGQETESAWTDSMGWTLKSLQESVFSMLEDMERIATASNSLHDLDLDSEKEYEEYPGAHITIGKGYASVLDELASCLPKGTIQLGKKVEKLFWNHSHRASSAPVVVYCEDGSVIDADHVIITVSLGVLKAGTSRSCGELHGLTLEKPVCRSVQDLRGGSIAAEGDAWQLFEPSLPPWKLEAISRLGFGVVDKLFLLVDSAMDERLRAFTQFVFNKESAKDGAIPSWMRKTFSMCPIYKDSNVLLCWLAGAEALESEGLSDDEIIDGVVSTLARFGLGQSNSERAEEGLARIERAESSDSEESSEDGETGRRGAEAFAQEKERLRSMFRGVLRSRWATNPLSQGSYTYVAVGASGLDIEAMAEPVPKCSNGPLPIQEEEEEETKQVEACDAAAAAAAAPLQLLFAGEATERHFYSTTHGAFLSGAREASRLIHHYGACSSPGEPV